MDEAADKVVSGITGTIIQINIGYWDTTDLNIDDSKHRSDIKKVVETLKDAGFTVK